MTGGWRSWARGAIVGALAVTVASTVVRSAPSEAQEPQAGQAGTDTSLPLTESAVTVRGVGPFADLEVTVNQTEELGNQAVSVTWTGADPTVRAGGAAFAEHFLQVMQCWTEPGAPEPVPEQCVFGATDGVFGGRNGGLFAPGGFTDDRVIARGDFESYDAADGFLEAATNWQWMPFRPIDGDTVDVQVDTAYSPSVSDGEYWLNQYFNSITTNEIVGGRTRPDGTGEELFEVATGRENSGLGCGQARLAVGAEHVVPDCWLVVVPRASATAENAGTIEGTVWAGGPGVMTSPLASSAWEHRIAVPLRFIPVDSACSLGGDQRAIVGSELPLRAVSSWQPVLCGSLGLPPFAYAPVSDSGARLQLVTGTFGAPGMAVTSQPLNASPARATNPVVSAPLTVSSLVIGFNIERVPDVEVAGPDSERLAGVRVAELNLTPRLVAKLLTQSYQGQVAIAGTLPAEGYQWAVSNPRHLDEDEDFLRFNPEFRLLRPQNTRNLGGLVLPAGTSDAARQLWEWVLADPEARAWLDGGPDEFGMVVNPTYATTPEANPSGIPFADPVPESYPKSDGYCYQAPNQGVGGSVVPPLLCGPDWMPFAGNYREAAQRTRAANDGARTTNNFDAITAARVWRADGPQRLGLRAMLSVVDSASAAQYGLQTARLSRAGDDGDARAFIAADDAGRAAAVASMVPSHDPAVLLADPDANAPDAYPLTTVTYAQVAPLSLDAEARDDYAAFVEYAAGAGQEPGLGIGQLPRGYSPLPPAMAEQARAAAITIRTLQPTAEPTPSSNGGGSGASGPGAGRRPGSAAAVVPTSAPADLAPTPIAPTATEDDEVVLTPALTAGRRRLIVPGLAVVVLLTALGALEITKRPRRLLASRATTPGAAVLLVALAAGAVAGPALTVRPAAGQDPGDAERRGLAVVDASGDGIDGGGSGTEFGFDLEGADECPGDSQNDDYRVYSFMVPAAVAPDGVPWDGLGVAPRSPATYDDFRMPLFRVDTAEFTAGFTQEQEAPGGPGRILELPLVSFAVYAAGEMPVGAYRIGVACTVANTVRRYWETEIEVTEAPGDPAGFEWRVLGSSKSDSASGPPVPALIAATATAAVLAVAVAVRRRTRPPRRPAPLELP